MNTAEYCADTIPQLEETVKTKLSSAFLDKVDMSPEIEVFHDVAAASIRCLVSGLEVWFCTVIDFYCSFVA